MNKLNLTCIEIKPGKNYKDKRKYEYILFDGVETTRMNPDKIKSLIKSGLIEVDNLTLDKREALVINNEYVKKKLDTMGSKICEGTGFRYIVGRDKSIGMSYTLNILGYNNTMYYDINKCKVMINFYGKLIEVNDNTIDFIRRDLHNGRV